MPCDQIRTTSVALGVANPTIVRQAIVNLGWTIDLDSNVILRFRTTSGVYGTINAGDKMVRVREGEEYAVSELNRACAREVVKVAAKRFGWQLTQTNKTNDRKFTAVRR